MEAPRATGRERERARGATGESGERATGEKRGRRRVGGETRGRRRRLGERREEEDDRKGGKLSRVDLKFLAYQEEVVTLGPDFLATKPPKPSYFQQNPKTTLCISFSLWISVAPLSSPCASLGCSALCAFSALFASPSHRACASKIFAELSALCLTEISVCTGGTPPPLPPPSAARRPPPSAASSLSIFSDWNQQDREYCGVSGVDEGHVVGLESVQEAAASNNGSSTDEVQMQIRCCFETNHEFASELHRCLIHYLKSLLPYALQPNNMPIINTTYTEYSDLVGSNLEIPKILEVMNGIDWVGIILAGTGTIGLVLVFGFSFVFWEELTDLGFGCFDSSLREPIRMTEDMHRFKADVTREETDSEPLGAISTRARKGVLEYEGSHIVEHRERDLMIAHGGSQGEASQSTEDSLRNEEREEVEVVEATEGHEPHEALEKAEVGEGVEVGVAPDPQQMKKSKKKTRLLLYLVGQ
ncbi:hypothetical protein Scep_025870 [Stephania cephalantha]|uniref:Uncharacterized protein n=1 Tax=Stephania cephalantha TaxID=152367 RepID=A0AAP0EJ22_9MAGN